MHDGSQIQNNLRKDATDFRNNEKRIRNSLKPKSYGARIARLCNKFNNGNKELEGLIEIYIEDGLIVRCSLCDFCSKNIKKHIIENHEISIKDYKKYYGQVVSNSKIEACTQNGKWISRNIENGIDMSDFLIKSVQPLIKDSKSKKGRKRRSENMSKLNMKSEFQAKRDLTSSKTAIETSKRPEIIKQRSLNLKKWREENPEKFSELIKNNFTKSWSSIPENILFQFCKENFKDNKFLKNQQIMSVKYFQINKTNRRQIDILDKINKIAIEYDGPLHFKNTKFNILEKYKKKDKELNDGLLNLDYHLIRISYDQFRYKSGQKTGYFIENCLKQLEHSITEINNKIYTQPTLFLIGDIYGKNS